MTGTAGQEMHSETTEFRAVIAGEKPHGTVATLGLSDGAHATDPCGRASSTSQAPSCGREGPRIRLSSRAMMHARFSPCPHCKAPLSYLEGVAGSTMDPQCPRCHKVVAVVRATFLMADHSRPTVPRKPRAQ